MFLFVNFSQQQKNVFYKKILKDFFEETNRN
jgi:hypothetical protein